MAMKVSITAGKVIVAALVSIFLLHLIGAIMGKAIGFSFQAGPAIVLLFAVLTAWLAIRVVEIYWQTGDAGSTFVRGGIVLLILVAGITVVVAVFGPQYLPSVFKQGASALQSAVLP
jgi:phosphoglycerol transferase MdoB-like AlkP superfamily enzyme